MLSDVIDEKQQNVLVKVIEVLDENDIPYEVTGGLAAIFYGAKRPLFDIDIDIHKKDFPQVRELFKDYVVEGQHQTLESEHFDIYAMALNIDGVDVDFSAAEDSYFWDKNGQKHRLDSTLKDYQEFDFGGTRVRVCDKNGLIAYKRIIARNTDLEDIVQIQAKELINQVKKLNLPKGKYIVFGSGPLAIYGIRESRDIDILALPEVFEQLKKDGWEETTWTNDTRVVIKDNVEVWTSWDFGGYNPDPQELINKAEVIDGIPIASLEEVLAWKKAWGREKDLLDIKLIEKYLANNPN